MIDPVLDLALRGALALLLGTSALAKLSDLRGFFGAVAGYRLVPPALERPAALALVALELAIAAALLFPSLRVVAGLAVAALLTLYALAIAVNLARGRRQIDCGCGGPSGRQALSEALVARNVLLAAAALALSLPVAERALAWLDLVTCLGAVAASAFLYVAASSLLARPLVAQ